MSHRGTCHKLFYFSTCRPDFFAPTPYMNLETGYEKTFCKCTCLSAYPPVHISACMPSCPSICLYGVCLFVWPSVCLLDPDRDPKPIVSNPQHSPQFSTKLGNVYDGGQAARHAARQFQFSVQNVFF